MEAKAYLEKLVKVLPEDHRDYEYFTKFLNSYETAKDMADNDEKKAIINDAVVKVANQLTFVMFREELLTEELEKEFRTLPKPEETTKALEDAHQARKDRYEELREMNQKAQDEQDEIDIFQRVLGGMTKEDAEAKLEEYKNAGGR